MARHIQLLNGEYFGITTQMGGKMVGMHSLNTSPSVNPFCLGMRKREEYICSHCYSKGSEARFDLAKKLWVHNYHILSTYRLKDSEIPTIRKDVFRFSAHGDLANRTHYLNLMAIVEKNEQTTFTLWSKRVDILRKGMMKFKNLIYIYSTPKLNDLCPSRMGLAFDKVFSVYTRPFLRDNPHIEINCGAKHCATCRLCYEHNDVVFINEVIKAPANKKR